MREHPNEDVNESRRRFFRNVTIGAALGAVGTYGGYKWYKNFADEDRGQEDSFEKDSQTVETSESPHKSESFEHKTLGLKEWWQLNWDEVLFIDKDTGAPLAKVPFQPFEEMRAYTENGVTVEKPYALHPTQPDGQGGYYINHLVGEWIDYVRERCAHELGINPDTLVLKHCTNDIRALLEREDDETELQAGIKNGDIRSTLDIVDYFGSKNVRGAESYNRIEYVAEAVAFSHSKISPFMDQELRQLLPAICAKESYFNDDVTSSSGARGICQFKPSTWKGLGYGDYEDFEPLTKQVEALGKHVDNILSELHSQGIGDVLDQSIQPLFVNQEIFERDFLLPLVINSYNAGAGTMRGAIRSFFTVYPLKELETSHGIAYKQTTGRECFHLLATHAHQNQEGILDNYRDAACDYTYYVYAAREAMAEARLIS